MAKKLCEPCDLCERDLSSFLCSVHNPGVCEFRRDFQHMSLQFEWNKRKADRNINKHGVSFEESKTVFGDPLAHIFDDEWHSFSERREIIIGHSERNRLLVVCFTEKSKGVIRIFSSRPVTGKERRDYAKHATSK